MNLIKCFYAEFDFYLLNILLNTYKKKLLNKIIS